MAELQPLQAYPASDVRSLNSRCGKSHLVITHSTEFELCPVNVSDMRSLEFTLKCLMIRLFRTYDSGVINCCMSFFGY